MTDEKKEHSLISFLKSLFPLLRVKDMHRVAVMLPNKETEAEHGSQTTGENKADLDSADDSPGSVCRTLVWVHNLWLHSEVCG